MRINKFVAAASGLSRRAADIAIHVGRVKVNGQIAETGQDTAPDDIVTLDNDILHLPERNITIMLNKPAGYVCSRNGQGSPTIYDLLPEQYKELKPVGRLDKDSSGLLLLTNDGELAHQLTHPSFQKLKIYEVELDQSVASADLEHLKRGVWLDDGLSRLSIQKLVTSKQQRAGQEILVPDSSLLVAMTEGRNRQIRRTFEALGYTVVELKRMQFGDYALGTISEGEFRVSS